MFYCSTFITSAAVYTKRHGVPSQKTSIFINIPEENVKTHSLVQF